VAPDGSVSLHAATRTDGGRAFDRDFIQAIKEAVEAQRFAPEQLDGQPVGTRITTEMEFSLGPMKRQKPAEARAANESCQVALSGPAARDRRVATNSPFRPLAAE
jgi:hypothetical protein